MTPVRSRATLSDPTVLWVLAALAMVAFAANSVLNRLALDGDAIDAGTFTLVRLASGAVVLTALALPLAKGATQPRRAAGSWQSAGLLLVYAATFSYSYLSLGAATGALLMFTVVQAVMFTAAIRSAEHPGVAGWSGLALALAGLLLLLAPGAKSPDPVGAVLMVCAGVAWAGYTLRGRALGNPIAVNAGNFLRSVPMAVVLYVVLIAVDRPGVHASLHGIVLAVLSGAVASGLGYALWYTVLPFLTRVQSGIVQLAPPPIAAIAGLLILSEPITVRVLAATVLVFGGVIIGLRRRSAT
ncbi:MAG: DMT family transporter [Nocardioidaceae bacterium]